MICFPPCQNKPGAEYRLEAVPALSFSQTGIAVDAPAEKNLVMKAYRLLEPVDLSPTGYQEKGDKAAPSLLIFLAPHPFPR